MKHIEILQQLLDGNHLSDTELEKAEMLIQKLSTNLKDRIKLRITCGSTWNKNNGGRKHSISVDNVFSDTIYYHSSRTGVHYQSNIKFFIKSFTKI